MITILSLPQNAPLAAQMANDLRAKGYSLAERVQQGRDHVVVLLVSSGVLDDPAVLREVESAFDQGQHVVPVLTSQTPLPKLLDHLQLLDFSRGYDAVALNARLQAETAPGVRLPVRVHTTKTRQSNARTLVALLALVITVFLIGTYFIAIGIIRMPEQEYYGVDTEVALTRDVMIGPTMQYLATVLPRSTEQAAEFDATLRAIPTVVRPFVAFTATAMNEQLQQFEITPTPEATEE